MQQRQHLRTVSLRPLRRAARRSAQLAGRRRRALRLRRAPPDAHRLEPLAGGHRGHLRPLRRARAGGERGGVRPVLPLALGADEHHAVRLGVVRSRRARLRWDTVQTCRHS